MLFRSVSQSRYQVQVRSSGSASAFQTGDILTSERTLDSTFHICDGSFVEESLYPTLASILSTSIYGIDKFVDNKIIGNLSGIAYGDGIFAMSDVYGKTYWSENPENGWHIVSSGLVSNVCFWVGMGWSGTYWYRYYSNGTIYQYATTANMKLGTWTNASTTAIAPISMSTVNGTVVVGGLGRTFNYNASAGALYPSSSVTITSGWSTADYIHKFKYVNGYYFAFTTNASYLPNNSVFSVYYATSLTAKTWTYLNTSCRDIDYIDGYWVYVGNSGYAYSYSSTLDGSVSIS